MKPAEHVERELRRRILGQEYPPGSHLREERLAAELGANRSAVRAALRALEGRRLVQRIPNRGAVVARLDAEQLFEIYDVLELLEGLTARLAAQHSRPEDWDALIELFGPDLEVAVNAGEFETYFDAIEQYRATANALAGSAFLSDVLSDMHDQTSVIIRRVLIIPGRSKQSLDEHRAVLDALRRGDAEVAEHLKRQNMRTARLLLEKYRSFLV
ncbi:GntR family transcriptional regulator [Pseudonocardia sichuanensis]